MAADILQKSPTACIPIWNSSKSQPPNRQMVLPLTIWETGPKESVFYFTDRPINILSAYTSFLYNECGSSQAGAGKQQYKPNCHIAVISGLRRRGAAGRIRIGISRVIRIFFRLSAGRFLRVCGRILGWGIRRLLTSCRDDRLGFRNFLR